MRTLRLLAAGIAAMILVGPAAAAPVELVEAGGAQFPFRSYVLTLPKPGPLSAARLHVTEDGTPVRGLSVLPAQAAKQRQFGVVLAIDASDSMRGKPIAAAMAAARVFAQHRNPNQQLAVVVFNNSVRVVQPLTTSGAAIAAALAKPPALAYGTHIFDALRTAQGLLAASHVQGGSVVLLSDGADVGSAVSSNVVLHGFAANHDRAFTVGLRSRAFDLKALQAVASATGGSFIEAVSPAALTPIFNTLGYRLAREYLLSYQSLAGPGVKVHVRARIEGIPGVAASEYVTPKLELTPAPPYHPPAGARILQSSLTMIIVALVIAAMFGWGIVAVSRSREGTLIERVGSFVSIRRPVSGGEEVVTHRRVDLLQGAEGTLARLRWWPRFKATLELADINASPTQIVLLTILATFVSVLFLYLIVGWLGILIGLGTPYVVRSLVQLKLARKRRAFADQLPDNLEVLAAALRAGHSLVGALSSVIEAAPEPSTSEFRRVIAEEQLGVPLERALGAVVERMDNSDLDQVALVARLQRETGSSAAEVIERVIETVRSRQELRRLVRTLTTQGRMSRWVLTALPLVLAFFLPIISKGYLDPLLHRGFGQVLLVFAALMVTAGSVVIGKIVNIKV